MWAAALVKITFRLQLPSGHDFFQYTVFDLHGIYLFFKGALCRVGEEILIGREIFFLCLNKLNKLSSFS